MDKNIVIGLVVIVVVAILAYMFYQWQLQQAALARTPNAGQQLAGGIGNVVGGIIGLAEGH